jgi:hypothetical protein
MKVDSIMGYLWTPHQAGLNGFSAIGVMELID